jgi:hypothetical protein
MEFTEFTQVLDYLIVGLPVSFAAMVVMETAIGIFSLWNKQVIKYAPESQPVNYFPVIEEAPEVENIEPQIPSAEEDELEMLLQKEVQDWFDAVSEKESAGMEVECKLEVEPVEAILQIEEAMPSAASNAPVSEDITPAPKRGRGRPKKQVIAAPAPKREKGRPKKAIAS